MVLKDVVIFLGGKFTKLLENTHFFIVLKAHNPIIPT